MDTSTAHVAWACEGLFREEERRHEAQPALYKSPHLGDENVSLALHTKGCPQLGHGPLGGQAPLLTDLGAGRAGAYG